MAQFEVYPNRSKATKRNYPYFVDIQSPHIAALETRIVIPLGRKAAFRDQAMKGLTPEITFEGQSFLLLTPQIASIPVRNLPEPIGSLAHFRDKIIGSLDFAITGI